MNSFREEDINTIFSTTTQQPQQRASRQTYKQENTKKHEGRQHRNKTQIENKGNEPKSSEADSLNIRK
jgi:hypothetical protein